MGYGSLIMDTARIQSLLRHALQCRSRGDMAGAEKACREVLSFAPDEPNALQFLGMIAWHGGDAEEGERLMRRSLEIAPGQPHVLNNLGNLLSKEGRADGAIDAYGKAIDLAPDFMDARLNLLDTLIGEENWQAAEGEVRALSNMASGMARYWNYKGLVEKGLRQFDAAEASFKKALELKPGYVQALHNLGLTKKLAGEAEEAVPYYKQARELKPGAPEIHYNLGNAYYDMGQIEEAVEAYKTAISVRPDYLAAHETLNKLYWQHEMQDEYLDSYRDAIRAQPANRDLRVQLAQYLILAGDHAEAEQVMRDALSRVDEQDPEFHDQLARAEASQGKSKEAWTHFNEAIRLAPDTIKYRLDMARFLIPREAYDEALKHTEHAAGINPDEQETLALMGQCWRFLGDERYHWLNDYEAFVTPYDIPVPPGYADIDAFNHALVAALMPLHRAKTHPAEQTLRGGTQTMGALFAENIKEVQEVRRSLEACIAKYIAAMARDGKHPLLRRKSDRFRFAGSWSVRLRRAGFHVNHVHSAGWISSCYYVSLPQAVANEDTREGWIKFGETNLGLGKREEIKRIIRPREGRLVLFPSYMFHGTVPFESEDYRTTIAFDVVPD